MSDYFLKHRNRISGPFSVAQLREMAERNELPDLNTILLSTDRKEWIPATEVQELFSTVSHSSPFSLTGEVNPPSLLSPRTDTGNPKKKKTNPALYIIGGITGLVALVGVGLFASKAMQQDQPASENTKDARPVATDTHIPSEKRQQEAKALKKKHPEETKAPEKKRPEKTKSPSKKQRKKEAQALAKLQDIEKQANAFVDAKDFEKGIEKYQQALDLIKNTKSDNAELAAAAKRISQAKTSASAKLNQKETKSPAKKQRKKQKANPSANVKLDQKSQQSRRKQISERLLAIPEEHRRKVEALENTIALLARHMTELEATAAQLQYKIDGLNADIQIGRAFGQGGGAFGGRGGAFGGGNSREFVRNDYQRKLQACVEDFNRSRDNLQNAKEQIKSLDISYEQERNRLLAELSTL